MKTSFKLLLVLSVIACGLAQNNDNADYWQDLYDSQWYDEEIEKLGLDSLELDNLKDDDIEQVNSKNNIEELGQDEKNIDENASTFDESEQNNNSNEKNLVDDISDQDIEGFIPQKEEQPETDINENINLNDNDYVLEDNRSTEEKIAVEENLADNEPKNVNSEQVDAKAGREDNIDDYVIEDSRLLLKDDIENFDELPVVKEQNVNDENEIDALAVPQEQNSGESKYLSSNEQLESNHDVSEIDMDKDKSLQNVQLEMYSNLQQKDIQESEKDLEETKQLLENISSSFESSDEDNHDKTKEDLDYDLKILSETFNKLSQDDKDDNKKLLFKMDIPEAAHDEIADYEEKFQRPYNEEAILKLREDYEESLNNLDYWDDNQNSNENRQNHEDSRNDEQRDIDIDEIIKQLDEELEKNADDDIVSDRKSYENDALLANEAPYKIDEPIEIEDFNAPEVGENSSTKIEDNSNEQQTHAVEELTSDELKAKIDELISSHKDELDVNSDGFDRNVPPVHITLKLDEAVEITSPDYPNFYPTDNIIDWIFEGDGMGIELNITDLSLNGFLGDYLLIKPGGIDHTGQEGLVFSFRLNDVRRYRFLDVDRMFVRFRAHAGMQLGRGFKLSVKLVGPGLELPEPITTPTPAPELPEETMTVFFEGLVAEEFRNRSEEFRSIIADMATLYINRHGIDPGYEPTINVTRITRVVECNINWPGHEPCAAVTFGVPLDYSEDQEYRLTATELEYMWFSYSYVDPFAARLRRMGIAAFAVPNEGSVMAAWLVIFLGVFISALMLGFAIWRWNCFEGYSRMPLYSDTDSIISDKRKDDLYPTPHQNLPPLYSDGHFEDRWTNSTKYDNTSKVELGGYTNTSYMADNELAYVDSDDDVIMSLPGQSNSGRGEGYTITSKHVFEV